MQRKYIFIPVIFCIILGIFILNPNKENPPTTIIPQTPLPSSQTPQTPKISVKNIQMNNFYLSQLSNRYGDVSIIDNTDYHITFIPQFHQFIINITNQPFKQYQTVAEQALLAKLEISPQEACMLNIEITTPRFANPDLAGQTFKPSFCP